MVTSQRNTVSDIFPYRVSEEQQPTASSSSSSSSLAAALPSSSVPAFSRHDGASSPSRQSTQHVAPEVTTEIGQVSSSGQQLRQPLIGLSTEEAAILSMVAASSNVQQPWHHASIAEAPRKGSSSYSWEAEGYPTFSSTASAPPRNTEEDHRPVQKQLCAADEWLSGSPLLGADIPSYHGLPVSFLPETTSLSQTLDPLGAEDKSLNSDIFHNYSHTNNTHPPYHGKPEFSAFLTDQLQSKVQYDPQLDLVSQEALNFSGLWKELTPQNLNILAADQGLSLTNLAARRGVQTVPSHTPWLVQQEDSLLHGQRNGMAIVVGQGDLLPEATVPTLGETSPPPAAHERHIGGVSRTETDSHGSSARIHTQQVSSLLASVGQCCEECRRNDSPCNIKERAVERRRIGHQISISTPLKCASCERTGKDCVTKSRSRVTKKHGRPSRTGRRIEQARLMHGSVQSHGAVPGATSMPNDPRESGLTFPVLSSIQKSEGSLSASVISGAISLRLLTCFFATAHIQVPIVEFASFSSRYNLAKGDACVMSVMLNGGDEEKDIPSMKVVVPGLKADRWPETGESTISTPGTSETLIAVMQAWAAHYTDMPIAFGSKAEVLGIRNDPRPGSGMGSSKSARQPAYDVNASKPRQGDCSDGDMPTVTHPRADLSNSAESPLPSSSKKAKRKQGVACDTCRLRRVRCDLMERKDGMACSRCQDKKIVCTDDYIQTKRRRIEAKGRKEKQRMQRVLAGSGSYSGAGSETGSSSGGGASSDGPYYYNSEMSMADQLGDNPDPLAWTEVPATPEILAGSSKFPSLIPLGQARQPFCHDLLTRAVVMMHKHQLLYRPSVEAVQALVLLVQLFYLVDPSFASEMTTAAAGHMRALGLQSVDEIDEGDQRAVSNLFNLMQLKRVWCSTWTGDAIATCVYRQLPNFEEEKAISIRSSVIGAQSVAGSTAVGNGSGASKASRRPSSPRPMPGVGGVPSAPPAAARGAAPELTPEMGLSFSVMALMQIGVLARFVTKHIDGISGSTLLSAQERFPMLPTSSDNKKLGKACHAVWKSNEALIAFFDRCTLKSWKQMEALKIFQPKSWIAACKITSAMLTLSVYRILGERHRLNADYLGAVSRAHGVHVLSDEDLNQSRQLKELFEHSSEKALVSCRRVARLIEKLLQKPSLTFQTGGIFLRQTFAVSQFIARTEVRDPAADVVKDNCEPGSSAAPPTSPPPTASKSHIDPRSISMHSTGTFIPVVQPEPHNASPSDLYDLALDFNAPLPTFDFEARRREVAACLEALDQLGFAWPMEEELESVKSIVRGEPIGRRFGHALA